MLGLTIGFATFPRSAIEGPDLACLLGLVAGLFTACFLHPSEKISWLSAVLRASVPIVCAWLGLLAGAVTLPIESSRTDIPVTTVVADQNRARPAVSIASQWQSAWARAGDANLSVSGRAAAKAAHLGFAALSGCFIGLLGIVGTAAFLFEGEEPC